MRDDVPLLSSRGTPHGCGVVLLISTASSFFCAKIVQRLSSVDMSKASFVVECFEHDLQRSGLATNPKFQQILSVG